jgi:hypothetical protein
MSDSKTNACPTQKNGFNTMTQTGGNRGLELEMPKPAMPQCKLGEKITSDACANKTLGHQLILESATFERNKNKLSCGM